MNNLIKQYEYTALERFLRYVKIDTQSDPDSNTFPSTFKQKDLAKVLVEELHAMGIDNAELDEHGYVYASLASNSIKKVPAVCFCSHMDTSPDCSGLNVKPLLHKNYKGSIINLPDDTTQKLDPKDHPELLNQIGNDIITASGTTLLGADNKAGVAEIMDAVHFLIKHPEVKHGDVKILFTPDEEIGRGVDRINLEKLGAQVAYTLDGETLGHLEDETFSADGVTIDIKGSSTHPGFAKDKMESAIKIAAAIIERLPKDKAPETTEKMQGFVHPVYIGGTIESFTLKFIIRDFKVEGLHILEHELEIITKDVFKNFPKSTYTFTVQEQYRNMKEVLDKQPEIVNYALEAIERSGVKAHRSSIRGGTDGSRLSFMGLPCPNIFAGEHAFHSKQEWVSVQDMHRAVDTVVNLVSIWEERA